MVGLLPLLRSLGPDVPGIAAVRFARVAWPCFGLAVVILRSDCETSGGAPD